MKYIDTLKRKYPNSYKEIYLATKEDDYLQVYELIHLDFNDNDVNEKVYSDYQPQSDVAKNFLKNLRL